MSSNEPSMFSPSRFRVPAWIYLTAVIAILLAVIAVAVGFAIAPRDTWLWLLVCFIFFSGMIDGALAWAATLRVAQARWSPAVNRLAQSTLMFVPFLLVILIILMAGVAGWAPWVHHPVKEKEEWLNVGAFVTRDILSLITLWILYFLLVRWSLKADAKARQGQDITDTDHRRLNAVAVVTVVIYSIVSSIIAWDLVMSLSPEWVSTMFSAYYFSTNLYIGMALLIIMAAVFRKPLGVEDFLTPRRFQDMGNLMLAFALFNMGLFFAQYVTIWYENLPEEVKFLIIRYDKGSWPYAGWASFITGYAAPFVLLQSRGIKFRPVLISIVAILAILGVGLERYIFVVPSIIPHRVLIFPAAILSMAGFAGILVLSCLAFLRRYAPISAADNALRDIKMEQPV